MNDDNDENFVVVIIYTVVPFMSGGYGEVVAVTRRKSDRDVYPLARARAGTAQVTTARISQ